MKLSLVLAITLFGLVALDWAEAGTMNSFCSGCQPWERKLWSEACKGQGGLGRPKGDSRDPCIICYKRNNPFKLHFRQFAKIWCANQENNKAFRIYHGMPKVHKALEGRVSCMKRGTAPETWDKMGRLERGQKWPKHRKFLEKIAQCPPDGPPKESSERHQKGLKKIQSFSVKDLKKANK